MKSIKEDKLILRTSVGRTERKYIGKEEINIFPLNNNFNLSKQKVLLHTFYEQATQKIIHF
jgi:hypothetical protein